jgi:translation elongation factor EF-Tu-like GTPase
MSIGRPHRHETRQNNIEGRTDELIAEIRDLLQENGFSSGNPTVIGSAGLALHPNAKPSDLEPTSRLSDAIDQQVPLPVRQKDGPFLMPVADVIFVRGRGLMATGRVQRGVIKAGEQRQRRWKRTKKSKERSDGRKQRRRAEEDDFYTFKPSVCLQFRNGADICSGHHSFLIPLLV